MSIPVVDLIGPPGSGKTSLVDCVLNCRGLNSRPVITRPAIAVKKPRRYCSRFGRMAFALSNKSSVFNKILLSGESSIKKNYSVIDSHKNFSDFVDFSLSLIYSQELSWLKKSLLARWWSEAFLDRVRLEHSFQRGLFCLADEPLSYRLSLFSCRANESVIKKYYEIMPRPCGIVHLEVDGDELLHRLKSRGRVTVRHEGLSEDALFADILFAIRVANLAKTVLESRGVPVLNLDGADDLEENAKIIIDFFKKV